MIHQLRPGDFRSQSCKEPSPQLSLFLTRLRERGLKVSSPALGSHGEPQYSAQCPAHPDRHPSLSVSLGESGKVLLSCKAGCDAESIVQSLGLTLPDLFPGLSLRAYSEAKKLPLDILNRLQLAETRHKKQNVILFPYFAEDGRQVLAVRIRWSLDGSRRFTWRKGDKPIPYGLPILPEARKQGYIVLCEGESDVQTLLLHDIPALGVPGADTWRNEWAPFLEGIETIYAVIEPDPGGETLKRKLLASPLRSRLKFITLRGHKDPSELHVAVNGDYDAFMTAWSEAMRQAQSPPEPPRGAELLAEIEQTIRCYIYLPDEGMYLLLAIYILFTHAAPNFFSLGYLAIDSPVPECGKSTLGTIIRALAANGQSCVNISSAAMFRILDKSHPTLVIDEADGLLNDPEKKSDIIQILNSGYKKNLPVIRLESHGDKWETREFDVFGPKVLIGINLGRLPDATRSRCINIHMSRALDEPIEEFDEETLSPSLQKLNQRISEFANVHGRNIKGLYKAVNIPELRNRAREIYKPLLATVAVVDPNRLAELRATVKRLLNLQNEEGPSQMGLRLLLDIREIFEKSGEKQLPTRSLIKRLKANPESPWVGWNHHSGIQPKDVGSLLKPFRIKSRNIKLSNGKVLKGYRRGDFEDAWRRYLPTQKRSDTLQTACLSATGATDFKFQQVRRDLASATEGMGSGPEIPPNYMKTHKVSGVAPENHISMGNVLNNHIWGNFDGPIEIPDFD